MFAAWLALDVGKRFGIECEHWEKQVRKKGWRRGRHQAGEGRLISRWHWIWQRVETSCIEQGALISTWIDISSVMETSPFQSFTLSASTPFLIFSPICLFLYSPLLLSFPLFLSRFLSFSFFLSLSLCFSPSLSTHGRWMRRRIEEGTHLFDLFVSAVPRGFSNVKPIRNECNQAQTLGHFIYLNNSLRIPT